MTRLILAALLASTASVSQAQLLVAPTPVDTSTLATKAEVQDAKASADAAVKSINGTSPVSGNATVPIYTDAQAKAAAQTITTFTGPNVVSPVMTGTATLNGSPLATVASVAAATSGLVSTVNGTAAVAGNVTVPVYTDAQAKAAAQTITTLTSPNITLPNGANLAHTIFQSRPSGGFITISGTTEQTVFAAIGDGSLTIQPVAMFVGARFHLHDRGRATTGLANVSAITSRLKIGSTTLVTAATLGLPASLSNIPFWSDIDCKVLSVGVTGSMLCYGALHYGTGASSSSVLMSDMSNAAAVTINTTIAQTWDATVQLSSLVGSPSIIIYDAFIIQEN